MSSAIELRKWLNRSDRDFVANLRFGIQVWRSMEFALITKHQIVTEEFCRNLPHLRKALKRTGEDPDVAWTTICEFLALKYSAGAIGSNVKEQLVQVLRDEANKTLRSPHGKLMEGLLLVLQNQAMQNYYRSSPDAFVGLIGTCFKYLNALVEKKADWLGAHEEVVVKLLAGIRTFVKQTPQLDVFQKAFTAEAYVPFAEMVVVLKQKGQDVFGEFFAIVQELYLPATSAVALKRYLVNFNEESEYFALFETTPVHALVLWLEAILIAYKVDTDTQATLHSFLFKRFFSVTQKRFSTSTELLQCVSYYLSILKRHDAQMSTKIDQVTVSAFIGQHVGQLFHLHCESNLADVLQLLCAALRLEPMMLEHQLVTMAVRCMVQKKDDRTTEIFSEFLCLVIDVFRRLRVAEKFIAQLVLRLVERLAQTKLSSKMKRKSVAATGTPKKAKALDDEGDAEDTGDIGEQTNSFFEYLRSELSTKLPSDHLAVDSSTPNEFEDISFAWPAGVQPSYIRFIAGLVTKPSLTVWKTLIFSMTDCITLLKEGHNDNNTLFLVDFTTAILCQYFDGARLAEHAHTTWDTINANIELTHSLLQEFGTAILSQEHNIRTMNSFLKCCKHLANFELLCFYYWPDTSVAPDSGRNIHPYLAPQQWTLIEQRITNFGRNECRANINRLYMQRIRAALLFKNDRPAEGLSGTPVLTSALTDRWQIEAILSGESSRVFVNQLNVSEVAKLCELVLESGVPLSLLSGAMKNRQFVTVLFVSIFKQLADRFGSKKSIFNSLDFEQLLGDEVDYVKSTQDLVTVVRQFVIDAPTVKKCNVDEIVADVARLREIPVEFVGIDRRNMLFVLTVALYVNVKASGEAALVKDVLSYLKRFVHFGETPLFFDLLTIEDWINIFGGSADVLPLYRDVFEKTVKSLNVANKQMFDDFLKLVSSKKTVEGRERVLDVGIVLLDCLSKERTCKEPLAKFRAAILARIRRFFKSDSPDAIDAQADIVDRTIGGFYIIASSTLCIPELSADVDAGLQTIFLAYLHRAAIQHNFGAYVKLLGLALTHKKTLNITDDQFRAAVDRCWSVFLASLKSSEPNEDIERNSELFLKTILNDKTQEEFVDFLEATEETDGDIVDSFNSYKHKQYAHIAKCQLNKSKGALFVEILKQVTQRILMSIRLRGPLSGHLDAVQKLLVCHKLVCVNIQTPITVELIDDILALLGEINIKRFFADPDAPAAANQGPADIVVNNPFANPHSAKPAAAATSTVDRSVEFEALHTCMSDVCFAMIQHRPLIIVDRVPQFTAVLRDLLQSVAWYKSGRKKEVAALHNAEVSMLAELSHRIENIFKSLTKHGKDVKRVAPYLLIFTINLMISNEQPTTVFSKIKTHFESICYDLISVCDHRVDGFIMRNCNEASKQMYEQMHKEFNKYHKFTGKV